MDEEAELLCEAIQVWQPDMDEIDAVCAAEAYLVEARFYGANPWQLLAFDILEINRKLDVGKPIVEKQPVAERDAKVISMDQWRKEKGL